MFQDPLGSSEDSQPLFIYYTVQFSFEMKCFVSFSCHFKKRKPCQIVEAAGHPSAPFLCVYFLLPSVVTGGRQETDKRVTRVACSAGLMRKATFTPGSVPTDRTQAAVARSQGYPWVHSQNLWPSHRVPLTPHPLTQLTLMRSIPASMRNCSTSFRAWATLLVPDIISHERGPGV